MKSAKMDLDESGLIYGRPFDDEPIELSTVIGEMGEITFRGKVISFDTREIRNEKTIVMYAVADFTDTIMVRCSCVMINLQMYWLKLKWVHS